MARMLMMAAALLLSACVTTSETVNDYSARSTVYGWIDIDQASGTEVLYISLRQYRPATQYPYFSMAYDEQSGGYVFWNFGFPDGAFKLDTMRTQSCLGVLLCSNTINEYDFGGQGGGVGAIEIAQPGVYHLGNLSLHNEESNFFNPSTFSLREASGGPSKRQMLEFILSDSDFLKEHPDVEGRIRAELDAVKVAAK